MLVKVGPIRGEADYDSALSELSGLMDAVPGTPEGDRLDILVTLIEAYEAQHWALEAPSDDPAPVQRARPPHRRSDPGGSASPA